MAGNVKPEQKGGSLSLITSQNFGNICVKPL